MSAVLSLQDSMASLVDSLHRITRRFDIKPRGHRLTRTLATLLALRENGRVSVRELHRLMANAHGYARGERTLRRELDALAAMGLVERVEVDSSLVFEFVDEAWTSYRDLLK